MLTTIPVNAASHENRPGIHQNFTSDCKRLVAGNKQNKGRRIYTLSSVKVGGTVVLLRQLLFFFVSFVCFVVTG